MIIGIKLEHVLGFIGHFIIIIIIQFVCIFLFILLFWRVLRNCLGFDPPTTI